MLNCFHFLKAGVKQAILRENSVKYQRKSDTGANQSNEGKLKNGETTSNFEEQKATAGGRGFINFSKAKERQKTIFASGKNSFSRMEFSTMIEVPLLVLEIQVKILARTDLL